MTLETFDTSYRPASYWEPVDMMVANITGDIRKANVQDAVRDGTVERLPEWFYAERLAEQQLEELCRRSTGWRGGELLPEYLPSEVEIARVTIDPAKRDVVAIRARRVDSAISYRAVTDFGVRIALAPKCSDLPLTLGELIGAVKSLRNEESPSALIESRWSAIAQDRGLAVAIEHIKVYSVYYPTLTCWYQHEALGWASDRLDWPEFRGKWGFDEALGIAGDPLNPLHFAAGRGDLDRMQALLHAGSDVNQKLTMRESPAVPFPRFGINDELAGKLAVRAGALCLPMRFMVGSTPLHFAAAFGRREAVALLLRSGASISIRNDAGFTPRMVAEAVEQNEIAQLLNAEQNI